MGLGPSKATIKEILYQSSQTDCNLDNQNCLKKLMGRDNSIVIKESFKLVEKSITIIDRTIDMDRSMDNENYFHDERVLINNITSYPFCTIGVLEVRFPKGHLEYFTATFIGPNTLLTLMKNVYNEDHGGMLVEGRFGGGFNGIGWQWEKVKREYIYLNNTDVLNPQSQDGFAVICFPQNISSTWMGIEVVGLEDLNAIDINIYGYIFNQKNKTASTNSFELWGMDGRMFSYSEQYLQYQICTSQGQEGAPIFYKDDKGGLYIIGVHCYGKLESNGSYGLHVTNECFDFVQSSLQKSRINKNNSNIEEDKVIKLNLASKEFGPLDMKYLIEFSLINLKILDLSSNCIQPQGAFYLSQGKFPNLYYLNLSFNEIEDEGVSHLSKAPFNSLTHLYLFHNNISTNGIISLCSSRFILKLQVLSLSENEDIQDDGCKIISESKNLINLRSLNLNETGIGDNGIKYLKEAYLPSLKKVCLTNNRFTDGVNDVLSSWKLSGIEMKLDLD